MSADLDQTEPVFELEIVVRGPSVDTETQFGLRSDRPTLARIEVPIDAARAWSVYRHALDQILQPTFLMTSAAEQLDDAMRRRVG